jgi:protocatechuate 3,4-dioxygenase beta subunit
VAPRKEVVEKIQRSLATPITFYGKVVDQNGDPVPDATINYNSLDKFDAPGSQYQG